MPTPLLCLDLGTACGWAYRSGAGVVSSGVAHFTPGQFDGGGMRFLRFRRWLTEMNAAGIGEIYFEAVRNHGKAQVIAAQVYGAFWGALTSWAEAHSIPYHGVGVGQVKKHWTGKGNADKSAMVAEAIRRGYAVGRRHDEADALAILHYAIDELRA